MQFYAEQVDWTYIFFKHLLFIDPVPEMNVYDVTKEAEIYNTQIGALL
ncbi:MAG: hypothetical protein ACMUIU_08260 [bacterium]